MRTVKKPEIRKGEILDTAQRLFLEKGYDKTTILDILDDVGIAKGTFYYYFKSKEEVRDAISLRIAESELANVERFCADKRFSAAERLFLILLALRPAAKPQPGTLELRQNALAASIRVLAPSVARLLADGALAREFSVSDPQTTAEILLAAYGALFDLELPGWTEGQFAVKADVFITLLERLLGAKPGRFDGIRPIFLAKL